MSKAQSAKNSMFLSFPRTRESRFGVLVSALSNISLISKISPNPGSDMDVVIITGGTKGLGRASVKKWLGEGWRIATCARDESDLALLEEELDNPNLLTQVLDVRDAVAVRGFVERVLDKWNRIDVLINNASILGPRETIEEYSEEVWREVIEINLNGAF